MNDSRTHDLRSYQTVRVTITDVAGTAGPVTTDVSDAVAAIRDWFWDAPAGDRAALDHLDNALWSDPRQDLSDLEAFLGIKVEVHA